MHVFWISELLIVECMDVEGTLVDILGTDLSREGSVGSWNQNNHKVKKPELVLQLKLVLVIVGFKLFCRM